MRELSLFSGAGGGLLASKYLLGWRTIGYVEWNEYCQKVIRQRIKDGLLDEAPIFGDIRTFISEGYAERYRGVVDVVSGGFPCQPFSVAGKKKAGADERNMWPSTCEVINIVRPPRVFLENNPGIVSSGYIGVVLKNLSEIRYDARWQDLSAEEVGAEHKREREWIVAYPMHERLERGHNFEKKRHQKTTSGPIQTLVQSVTWPDVSDPHAYGSNDGLAYRVERTQAIGNGQVPIVAATAWDILSNA
jgi:DNA (cytosine-5)-methyltransferase 1